MLSWANMQFTEQRIFSFHTRCLQFLKTFLGIGEGEDMPPVHLGRKVAKLDWCLRACFILFGICRLVKYNIPVREYSQFNKAVNQVGVRIVESL